ncbi:hypothetical protein BWQ96_03012 [Gracilariopsis chorda]|uniref:Uncharacterized protein n=1 Tax=Gracilariopsis chorda TaxID=448386 RepID=A0A2V3IZX9_9FLOR|nr:hypothetical protein BWQ96_03012 [Gracilariopsis chorda]|eukprot:PXF47237.1 hypothetical protein BWQ96_03012 [Gracilariopsis chorda]
MSLKPGKIAQRALSVKPSPTSIAFLIFLVSFPILLLLHDGVNISSTLSLQHFQRPKPRLNVLTLIYDQKSDHINVAHNCRMISSTSHKFFIHTDDILQPYCKECTCIEHKLAQCPCPTGTHGCQVKNPCEKVEFLIESVTRYEEFLFLDNDLIIMKPEFLDHMWARSRAHDFLASYAHLTVNSSRYLRNFNSGLMFIRRLPDVNYTKMRTSLYFHKKEQDQGVVSTFFQQNYKNWDSLSWKWHCRNLKRGYQDVPLEACYTFHDRVEVDDFLIRMNTTRLTIP